MINLIVNTKDKEYVYTDLLPNSGASSSAIGHAVSSARTLHPDWTSMVLTIARKDGL